jgi:hypothetical protein
VFEDLERKLWESISGLRERVGREKGIKLRGIRRELQEGKWCQERRRREPKPAPFIPEVSTVQ